MQPTLEFSGSGEFTVISPNAQNILAGLAEQIVGGSSSSTTSSGSGTTVTVNTGASTALALAALSNPQLIANITPTPIDTLSQESDHVAITVTGVRKYFLSEQ
jgi:hypothetical protein